MNSVFNQYKICEDIRDVISFEIYKNNIHDVFNTGKSKEYFNIKSFETGINNWKDKHISRIDIIYNNNIGISKKSFKYSKNILETIKKYKGIIIIRVIYGIDIDFIKTYILRETKM